MKLVLAGSKPAYQLFINKLWSKDKNVSEYRYVSSTYVMRGYNANNNTLVKLGSFSLHPEADSILREAEERGFNISPRRERMRGLETGNASFGEGGIVRGVTPASALAHGRRSGYTGYYGMICTPRGTTVRITDGD